MRHTTLYHLLKGKKTSSILVFGKFYDLLNLFSLFPNLSQQEFTSMIHNLINNEYLEVVDDKRVKLTSKGQKVLVVEKFTKIKLKQFQYDRVDQLFFQRLMFATQIQSNKVHNETHYEPVDNDAFHQMRMKVWLDSKKHVDLSEELFSEWVKVIESLDSTEQSILVEQLAGYQEVGMTVKQIANLLDLSDVLGYLIYKTALHKMLDQVIEKKEALPVMSSLLHFVQEEIPVSSHIATQTLFLNGMSPSEIANQRRLKPSTISDHLTELYLTQPSQAIKSVIPKDILKAMTYYLNQIDPDFKNWKYSDVTNHIEHIDFYLFRWCQFYFLEQEVSPWKT